MTRRYAPLILLSMLTLVVTGCARQEDVDDTATMDAAEAGAVQSAAAPPPPPPVVNGVVVGVSLSPDAQARLSELSEKIVVEASFVGDPTAESEGMVNDLGMIELGSAREELTGPGRVSFPETLIDKTRLDLIIGQPQVTINVMSGKTAVPDNLLACTFYWETLSEAGQGPVEIPCTLVAPAQD